MKNELRKLHDRFWRFATCQHARQRKVQRGRVVCLDCGSSRAPRKPWISKAL